MFVIGMLFLTVSAVQKLFSNFTEIMQIINRCCTNTYILGWNIMFFINCQKAKKMWDCMYFWLKDFTLRQTVISCVLAVLAVRSENPALSLNSALMECSYTCYLSLHEQNNMLHNFSLCFNFIILYMNWAVKHVPKALIFSLIQFIFSN